MKIVPDTSVVIDGRITSMIKTGEYTGSTIIVPEAVVAELEAQANQGREIGFSGLTELQNLSRMAAEGTVELRYVGVRPSLDQVKLASGGEIDALIRNVALEYDATFITSDVVQSEVAKAKGLDVIYLKPQIGESTPLILDGFFDENTIAIHLKERVPPVAKKGTMHDMHLVQIRDAPMTEYELRTMAQEILERAKRDPDGFIEIERRGITVVQIGSIRISIARRPFSDGMEITAVRPIVDVTLEQYAMADLIKERITDNRCGVLIAGPPGAGKSTLAQSIATFLSENGFIVKTMEAPRDLQVPDNITQYTALEGSMTNTAEVLLLVRPDAVIFDELRKSEDFRVFADMRLAGVGMIGVVHAMQVQDAVQRVIERIEAGVLPQIIGTIVFVDSGEITGVYDLDFSIKVPEGMHPELHMRPVTTVRETSTGAIACEVFKYEGETIVMPARGLQKEAPARAPPVQKMPVLEAQIEEPVQAEPEERYASMPEEETGDTPWHASERDIQRELSRFTDGPVDVFMKSDTKAVAYIEDKDVPAAIGRGGKNIAGIVNKLGIGIDIRPRSELPPPEINQVEEVPASGGLKIRIEKRHLTLVAPEFKEAIVDVFSGKEYLFTATVNEKGEIELAKSSSIAQELIRRYNDNETIRLRPV
ncbi:PINc/VapC family ATPase [Methanofollis tationis]|uniref:Flp pilus assembly complex ATPase component TadA n=1 Tax=Methanofollis tationis TaxID=81417 RepID=A0A7K4HQW9_9EURY|nr:PINc/VapC family ATPase [Methanofollis tationis]NVO67675.1 Flp pilus assembly complex ATPase component TadA [Methanofollis tationis]